VFQRVRNVVTNSLLLVFSVLLLSACGIGGTETKSIFVSVDVENLDGELILINKGKVTLRKLGLEFNDSLIVDEDGRYTFQTPLNVGSHYTVAIDESSDIQHCELNNSTGRVVDDSEIVIDIDCAEKREFHAPADVTMEASAEFTKVLLGTTNGSGFDEASTVILNDAPGQGFPLGQTEVIWVIRDADHSMSDTQLVTIIDTTPPVFITPDPIVQHTSADSYTFETLSPPVVEELFPDRIELNASLPMTIGIGSTTVLWTAYDSSGNSASVEQAISVLKNQADPQPVDQSYTISASLFGITGGEISMQLNQFTPLTVTAAQLQVNSLISFPNTLLAGDSFQLSVSNPPVGQRCSVTGGVGVVSGDVNNIQVFCFAQITPVVESGSGKATLSWNAAGAQSYSIYLSSNPDFNYKFYPDFTDARLFPSVTSPAVITPLDNGQRYYAVVVATFSGGHEIASDPVEVFPNRSSIEQIGTSDGLDWGIGMTMSNASDLLITGNSSGNFAGTSSHIGSQDIVLVNINPNGVEQWRQQSGSIGEEYGRSIAVDLLGDILVSGETGGDFGGAIAGDGDFDQFYAKYDATGVLMWAFSPGRGRATSIKVDSGNNIIVGGWRNETAQLCSVLKADETGAEIWSRTIGSASTKCNDVVVAADDSIYAIGSTASELTGPGSNSGDWDYFVARYTPEGDRTQLVQLGTLSTDYAYAMTLDQNGELIITGMTGGLIGDNLTKNTFGRADVFVIKLDSNLNKIWSYQIDAGAWTQGHDVVVSSVGEIYVTGSTEGTVSNESNAHAGLQDIFLIKLSPEGSLIWSKQYGTGASDVGNALLLDEEQGLVFLTGFTYGNLGDQALGGDADMVLITEPM